MPESVWTRTQRPRREQPTLSREQIVGAALELLDSDGLDGLSMRRLGTKLNAGATTIYWHVANKDELLELALDHVMAELAGHPPESGWRAAATAYAHSLRALILRHAWTVTLFGSRPMLGPNAARGMDRLLEIFETAGFSGFELDYAQSALVDYVIGAAGGEASWLRNQRYAGVTTEDWMDTLGPYLDQVGQDHPRLAAHIENIWSKSDADVLEARFEFGLQALLDGFRRES